MIELPREAQLEYVVYEPALASLSGDGVADPVAEPRASFVDAPRAACLSADDAARAEARRQALATPSWSAATLTVRVTLRDGATTDLELRDEDEILHQLTLLYAIAGWPGVAAAVTAVDDEARRRAKTADAGRWAEASRRVAAARDNVAVAVLAALEVIERRAGEIVIDRLNRTRNFAAACWTRYGANRGQKLVDSLWKGGEFVPTYEFTDLEARGALHAALVPIMNVRREVATWWLIAYTSASSPASSQAPSDEEVEAALEAVANLKKAERKLDDAIVDAAHGSHPLAAALAHSMSWLTYDEVHMGRVGGEFLDVVRAQTERWAAAPPVPTVPELSDKGAWPDVVARGPEAALVERLGDPAVRLEPLASPQILQTVGHALRKDGDLMSGVVLVHLKEALAAAEQERRAAGTLKGILSGAAAAVTLALNVAAIAYPALRPAAGTLDAAVTGYGALEGVRAALELDAVRDSAVQRVVAEAEQRDLHRLGRAVSEHLEPSGVVPALIQAGIPLASLELTVARAGTRLHWLDASDLMLSLVGP